MEEDTRWDGIPSLLSPVNEIPLFETPTAGWRSVLKHILERNRPRQVHRTLSNPNDRPSKQLFGLKTKNKNYTERRQIRTLGGLDVPKGA